MVMMMRWRTGVVADGSVDAAGFSGRCAEELMLAPTMTSALHQLSDSLMCNVPRQTQSSNRPQRVYVGDILCSSPRLDKAMHPFLRR